MLNWVCKREINFTLGRPFTSLQMTKETDFCPKKMFSKFIFKLTSSLQSTCTFPLSRTFLSSISSPRRAAKCNWMSDSVSFCKTKEKWKGRMKNDFQCSYTTHWRQSRSLSTAIWWSFNCSPIFVLIILFIWGFMLHLQEIARSTRKNCKLIDQTAQLLLILMSRREEGWPFNPSKADFVTIGLNFYLERLISRAMSTSDVDATDFLTKKIFFHIKII